MIYGYAKNDSEDRLRLHGAEKVVIGDAATLRALANEMKQGDTLMITALYRLARNAKENFEIVSDLIDRGIRIHVLGHGIIDDSPNGRLVHRTCLTFSESEREHLFRQAI